jgi:hypothetical protein
MSPVLVAANRVTYGFGLRYASQNERYAAVDRRYETDDR